MLAKQKDTGKKGAMVRFFGEGHLFCKYLESKMLVIDVWDGETLLQIGNSKQEKKF